MVVHLTLTFVFISSYQLADSCKIPIATVAGIKASIQADNGSRLLRSSKEAEKAEQPENKRSASLGSLWTKSDFKLSLSRLNRTPDWYTVFRRSKLIPTNLFSSIKHSCRITSQSRINLLPALVERPTPPFDLPFGSIESLAAFRDLIQGNSNKIIICKKSSEIRPKRHSANVI